MAKRNRVEIKPHPRTPETHRVALVESRGYVYACTWAEPFPDEAEVRRVWREERRAFRPYDESTGSYLR